MWAISPLDEGPLLAYRKMGVLDWGQQGADMSARKHLLTTPQHRAFRKLIAAEVQRHASTLGLESLMSEQDAFVAGVRERLVPLTSSLGLVLEQVEVNELRPSSAEVLEDMASGQVEALREEASRVRLESRERQKTREVESATRMAQREVEARSEREAADARAQLSLEQEKANLEASRLELERQRLQLSQERRRFEAELEHGLEMERLALRGSRELADERRQVSLERSRQERQSLVLDARLAELRADAEARRDASVLLASAEEQKSEEGRRYELQRATVQSVGAALAGMPIKDARWISVGNESPMGSVLGMFEALASVASARKES